ncbi:hypothetical protein VSS74_13220 [Conexibacter stalactiti]|uniref:SMP-30/Gluconolactonase/LRE-like region domain-containing protein n=1 Tax=Conexibacter stalactiti TaxID=1940611 RepID=A0ABU4HPS0_9ACTN|nr:hypothetical protein [Conexibacter stalactiti]MDW5595303.1 hypothetical protein [Conexibacter stalactiti]MEC5035945.1 hypothetical protein [Conexibacter stalactiti]
MTSSRRLLVALAAAVAFLTCAAGAHAATLTGQVEAAGRPVAQATVRLFAAGAGSASALGTDRSAGDGSFSIDYEAPADDAQLYVVATGGNRAGRALGAQVRLLAIVGPAEGAPTTTVVEERGTVAGAYALARFIDGTRISGPAPGLANAFTTAANLFEARTGKVSFVLSNSPSGLATEALPTFNTLANALASCTTGTRRSCRRLFAAAQPRGGARPADTLAAVVAIARNPSQHRAELFALAHGSARRAGAAGERARGDGAGGRTRRADAPVYQPALTRPPNSWILALVYTGGGMNAPGRVAFDAAGNAWAGNNFARPGTTAGLGLTALTPSGQPILGSPYFGGGIRGPGWGTAVGADGRVWNANFAGDSISVNAPDGTPLSPSGGYTAGSPTKPQGVAVGQNGDVWIASFGDDSVIRYPGGNPDPATAQKITRGGIENPFGIQVDARGHVWVSNGAESRSGSVTELLPDGTPVRPRPIRGGGLLSPQGVALDSAGNVWVGNLLSRSVTRLLPNGRIAPESPIRGSIEGGWGVAVDGADHVWVAGFFGGNVSELCGVRRRTCPPGLRVGQPISPPRAGYDSAAFEHITAVQIDPSGNVWLANNWTTGSPLSEPVGGNGLVQLVGAATPVRTPLIGLPRQP